MEKFIYSEGLWDRPFLAAGNRTPRQIVAGPRANDPVLRAHFTGEYARRLMGHLQTYLLYGDDPGSDDLTRWWETRGILREIHTNADPDRTWISYVPGLAVRYGYRCPVWILNHAKGRDIMDMEGWGFAQMAAEKQLIVLTLEEGNSAENCRYVLDAAARCYPVDRSRVYMVGHSFSGSVTGRIAVSDPTVYAGVCLLGSQYSGLDSSEEETARAAKLHMPRIDVHGTAEKILPFNRDTDVPASPQVVPNVTPTDMGREACYREQAFWHMLNGCRPVVTGENDDIQEVSCDIAERKIGTKLAFTQLRVLGGVPHYMGDIPDGSGRAMIRHVAVEGAPHYPSAWCAELAWEFLHWFSRDQENGELCLRD